MVTTNLLMSWAYPCITFTFFWVNPLDFRSKEESMLNTRKHKPWEPAQQLEVPIERRKKKATI